MNKNIVYRSLRFFFRVHYLALFYAFLIVPLAILGGIVGKFIAYPFILLAFFTPIGPISIAVQGIHLYGLLPPEFSPSYNPLLIIADAMVFKLFIYMLLRRTRIASYSTPLILSVATLITCTISTLVWRHIDALVASLVTTLSMDLTVLSYVKYRDAVNGIASRGWIPILVILWSSAIWLPMVEYSREWLNWIEHLFHPIPLTIVIAIWITITVFQIIFSIEYYHITKKI